MKLLSPFYKIRGALAAWRDADPRQAGRLGTVLKFFAVMLVLTLAARGIACSLIGRHRSMFTLFVVRQISVKELTV